MRVLKQILDRGDTGRDRLRRDRHARDPALADIPRGLRPADARQHERPSPRRAALSVRRPGRDHHADAQGSAHPVRPLGRHHRLDADASRPACSPCRSRMSGPGRARRATRTTSTSTGASRAPTGVAKGTIGWPTGARLDADLRLDQDDRRQMGDADLGHDVVPACLHRRDGAAAVRGEDRRRRRRSRSPTTSRPWRWSRPATARSTRSRTVKLSEISINA